MFGPFLFRGDAAVRRGGDFVGLTVGILLRGGERFRRQRGWEAGSVLRGFKASVRARRRAATELKRRDVETDRGHQSHRVTTRLCAAGILAAQSL